MGTSKVINRNLIEIQEEGTIIITDKFLNQVKYLCNEISEVEWSGLVFFKTEGSPQKLSTFKIIPEYIHLMHKGSSTYTEYDDDGSLVELHKLKPEFDPFSDSEFKYGKIHSHNTMQVFHSGTDIQDLQDQAGAYEYYLSVIVNNFMDVEAKIAFVANIPVQKITPTKFKGMKWELPTEEILGVIDLDVEMESSVISIPEELKERTKVVIEEAKESKIVSYTPGRWGGISSDPYNDLYDEGEPYSINPYYKEEDKEIKKGKELILTFLHGYFNYKLRKVSLFHTIEDLPLNAFTLLSTQTEAWVRKLKSEDMELISIYLTENEDAEEGTQLYEYFSEIWNSITSKEIKEKL